MPFLSWVWWSILCKYLFVVIGDLGSPPEQVSKLSESILVLNLREQWLWVMPPIQPNPDDNVEDGSHVLCWDFLSLPWPCSLFARYCMGQKHHRLSCCLFSFLGEQRWTSMLWTVTPRWGMSWGVQRRFPFPHCPHAKINIWYESQGTEASWTVQKVLSSSCCCCCCFFNTIFLVGWVTVYSRIKGWRRDFGIPFSSSMFLLFNLDFFCLFVYFRFFVYLLIWVWFFFSPFPFFHKRRRGEIVCMCVCGALPSRETKQTTSIAFALTSLT